MIFICWNFYLYMYNFLWICWERTCIRITAFRWLFCSTKRLSNSRSILSTHVSVKKKLLKAISLFRYIEFITSSLLFLIRSALHKLLMTKCRAGRIKPTWIVEMGWLGAHSWNLVITVNQHLLNSIASLQCVYDTMKSAVFSSFTVLLLL